MNIFGITSILIFFSSIGFGLSLYSSNRESRANRQWFIASIFIAIWGLSLYGVTSANSSATALKWQYILDISAMLIPATYFSFISELLGLHNYFWRRVSLYIGALLAVFSVTPLFKAGVTLVYGFYWIDPGPFYWAFPVFFVVYTIASLYLLYSVYRVTDDIQTKAQIRNTLYAGLIGFGGGITNFLPQVINVYPFGNYFVILYVFIMSRGVLKYKLMNTKILSTQLFAGATVLIFLFNLLHSGTFSEWFVNMLLFMGVLLFSIMIVRSVYREVEQRQTIEKLVTKLEDANTRLTELDQMKSEFISLASHQIRGPLAAIKGYASLILEGDYGRVPKNIQEPIETIFQSCQSLVTIVEDFLNVSRIEQGRMKYDFTDFDIVELVRQVITELRPSINKKGLRIVTSLPEERIMVNADVGKIKQVIGNLVDNATKYTKEGSLTIALEYNGISKKVLFTISDTGVGISPETLPKLFQKFSRAEDAAKANILGTGLGLYVAKELLKAHEGRIWAESAGVGKGSTFFVEMPLSVHTPVIEPVTRFGSK